ncbi:hypothetical protein RHODGE_RHODGE_04007 [Rhodoplanes serenus]|uniref:HTH cro/C1-type domain-containing protein n=1 Tax=Rhodoplanes serenus TaxID=200615 RepID=A0A447CZS8_9BRAD|nr:hypothetical protein [Rhodoplanes serenus]VCU10803.1 hypothetical protein RHODGE_RHODGE_04007 [Rhodoplanes serenus]
MKLLDYMRREGVDDEALAARLGSVTAFAVKKWKYGERIPDALTIVRLEEITGGAVTLRDWADQQRARPATERAAS